MRGHRWAQVGLARAAWRGLTLATLLGGSGCASVHRDADPVRPDFAVVVDDLAAGDAALPDLATATASDGGRDAGATPPDLAPDLATPAACGDAGTSGHLFVAGVGASDSLHTSNFTVAGGWESPREITVPSVAEVALALVAARPLVLVRQDDGTLGASDVIPCSSVYGTPRPLASSATALRPALVGGARADAVFRGATSGDLTLYHVGRGSDWSAPVAQSNMTTTVEPALVRFEGGLHVVFANAADHDYLYEGTLADTAGGGTATLISSAASTTLPPRAVVDSGGVLHVVWTGTDSNLRWIARPTSGAWDAAGPHPLCDGQSSCLIDSHLPPALALDAAGAPTAAWAGIDVGSRQVFVSSLHGAQWSAAARASGSCATGDCQTTLGPALATGLGGALLELVFVRDSDGKAAHARLLPVEGGFGWLEPLALPGGNYLTTPSLLSE